MQPPLALLPIFVAAGMHKTTIPKTTSSINLALPTIPTLTVQTLPDHYASDEGFEMKDTDSVAEMTVRPTTATSEPSTLAFAMSTTLSTSLSTAVLAEAADPMAATNAPELLVPDTSDEEPTKAAHDSVIKMADAPRARVKRSAVEAPLPEVKTLLSRAHITCVSACDVADAKCLTVANWDASAMRSCCVQHEPPHRQRASSRPVAIVASPNVFESVYHGLAQGNLSHISQVVVQATKAIERIFNSRSATDRNGATDDIWLTLPAALTEFFANRTSLENTSIVLAISALLYMVMSWTSRLGNLGRFSPFGRDPPKGSNTVSEDDYSYITADDLRRHQAESGNQHSIPGDAADDHGPPRDTDILNFRNKSKEYPTHFPAYSIAKGEVTVGQIREQAARRLGSAPRRVKLVHQGRTLKDDARTCKQEGLRHNSEILCISPESGGTPSESDDDEDDDGQDSGTAEGETAKRRRNRGKKSKRRNKREADAAAAAESSRAAAAAAPTTPLGKLNALWDKLQTYVPDCKAFEASPPSDPAKREFEHKRLSETILTQVLLKTDAVETDGDPETRARRKELVRETQDILSRLDAVMKR